MSTVESKHTKRTQCPRIILSALASAKLGPSSLSIDPWLPINTPDNVVRGNQNYANKILHELQTVDRMSTNLLSRYLLISKRENSQLGNVALNSFHFYTRLIVKLVKNQAVSFVFVAKSNLSHYTLLGIN